WHAEALRSARTPEAVAALFARVEKIFPERHPLRDLYVKNQAEVETWNILRVALTPEQMASAGVSLEERNIDLSQVLSQFPLYPEISFLKTYTLFEVKNLDKAVQILPRDKAELILRKLEAVITEQISPDQQNAVRRAFMQLEKIVRWPELREHRRTDTRVFDEYLDRIITMYPEASFERDEILESINMDLAYTPEQIRKVEFLKYNEQIRWPKEKESEALRAQYTGFEKTRGFLGMLNAAERTQYLIWFGGGQMPLAETLSAEKTHISLEDRKRVFWGLSPVERRNIMYDLCLGKNGALEGASSTSSMDKPWPSAHSSESRTGYIADNLFETAFGNNKINPELPDDAPENVRGKKMVQIIFREMLVGQPNAGRRTELLTNILEAMGQVEQEGRELRVGELIRVMLEQIGVVGIKIGQILSEQPGLLPDSIRQDLMQLKDKTPQFSKRGILTYLESAGWVRGDESKVKVIGEALGSASIKQVQDGRLEENDKEVAIKAKRPSIDKNYKDDLLVAKHVFAVLEREGYPAPAFLLTEVERVISEELSFVHEAENQIAMGKSLRERSARIDLDFGDTRESAPLSVSAPLNVSEVFYPGPEQKEDIGLMVEEKVKGLSLKEIQAYQSALLTGDAATAKVFQGKISQLYGNFRVLEIENKITRLNIDKLQAELAIEFLRQVNQGGIFHADLHSGNFFIDFTPQISRGEIYNQQAFFIDLGSVGFSKTGPMPDYVHETAPADFNAAESFRDFMTALFVDPPKFDIIASMVNKYTGLAWDGNRVKELTGDIPDSGEKIKKIFYSILEEGKGSIDPQFRYFLKAFATAAGHLSKLRDGMAAEMKNLRTPGADKPTILPKVMSEKLINLAMFV
ncbi:MAG: AarF/UbiB family protein, partial [Patescibacteria group bacterium]